MNLYTLKKDGKSLAPPFSQDKKKWGKVRKISMTVNLNNSQDYEGGNLKFDLGPHFKGERFKILRAEIGHGTGKNGEVISDGLEIGCGGNKSIKILF